MLEEIEREETPNQKNPKIDTRENSLIIFVSNEIDENRRTTAEKKEWLPGKFSLPESDMANFFWKNSEQREGNKFKIVLQSRNISNVSMKKAKSLRPPV